MMPPAQDDPTLAVLAGLESVESQAALAAEYAERQSRAATKLQAVQRGSRARSATPPKKSKKVGKSKKDDNKCAAVVTEQPGKAVKRPAAAASGAIGVHAELAGSPPGSLDSHVVDLSGVHSCTIIDEYAA